MKSDDIVMVVFVSIVGAVISFFLMNALLGNVDEKSVSFNVPTVVTAGLAEPDAEIFNAGAINPTVEVYVGNCRDDNHDGILSEAELEACGEAGLVTDNLNE